MNVLLRILKLNLCVTQKLRIGYIRKYTLGTKSANLLNEKEYCLY